MAFIQAPFHKAQSPKLLNKCNRLCAPWKVQTTFSKRYVMTSNDKLPPVLVPPELKSVRILGLGVANVDILASVDSYPEPDQKVRTKALSFLGGGNTANSLTAARRLGLECKFVSKVGNDTYGSVTVKELAEDGVHVDHVLMKSGVNTSFTYVVVDTKHGTRTCFTTPSNEDLLLSEVTDCFLEQVLQDVTLVVLDGRHTLAAIQLAKEAKKRAIPILIDVERDRPHIKALLPYADYIVTNSQYPFMSYPSASDRVDAMVHLLETYDLTFVISTLGVMGSTMLRRDNRREKSSAPEMIIKSSMVKSYRNSRLYEVIDCPSWPADRVIDTTGAGDAFIGGVAYGLATNMPYERMMCLAARVASAKLASIGGRAGLPRRENLPSTLLGTLPVL